MEVIAAVAIPPFDARGRLPRGIHWATWSSFVARFGHTRRRRFLLSGMHSAFVELRNAGCVTVYVGGSFVIRKASPRDYDICWDTTGVDLDRLDPVLLTFDAGRATQKAKYFGELFPADSIASSSQGTFLEFFQTERDADDAESSIMARGIVAIDLRSLES
jgi:hypothetical protein